MDQDMEKDLIELTDEDGNTGMFEVLDYFFYNGQEYALVGDYVEDAEDSEEDQEIGCFVMRIDTVTDENGEELEEFNPIEDPELEDRLFEIATTNLSDDEEEE